MPRPELEVLSPTPLPTRLRTWPRLARNREETCFMSRVTMRSSARWLPMSSRLRGQSKKIFLSHGLPERTDFKDQEAASKHVYWPQSTAGFPEQTRTGARSSGMKVRSSTHLFHIDRVPEISGHMSTFRSSSPRVLPDRLSVSA